MIIIIKYKNGLLWIEDIYTRAKKTSINIWKEKLKLKKNFQTLNRVHRK